METAISPYNRVKSAFSIYIALLPLLSMYYSGIPGINIADIILGFYFIYFVPKVLLAKKRFPIRKGFDVQIAAVLFFVAYVILHVIMNFLVNRTGQSLDILIRSTRIVFYLVSATILLPYLLDSDIFIKTVKWGALIASAYVILQVVVYTSTGKVLHGFLPYLPLYNPEYNIYYKTAYLVPKHRPTSFFLEPSHFSRYASLILPFILMALTYEKRKTFPLFQAILLTVGILLSTSSIGMALTMISWSLFFFLNLKDLFMRKGIKIFALSGIIFTASVVALVMFMPSVRFTINRSLNFGSGSAFEARLGSVLYLFDANNNILRLVFGNGYGSVPEQNVWMADIVYILYGTGVIGIACIFLLYLNLLFKKYKTLFSNLALFVTFALLFVDDSFNSVIIVFILAIQFSVWINGRIEIGDRERIQH